MDRLLWVFRCVSQESSSRTRAAVAKVLLPAFDEECHGPVLVSGPPHAPKALASAQADLVRLRLTVGTPLNLLELRSVVDGRIGRGAPASAVAGIEGSAQEPTAVASRAALRDSCLRLVGELQGPSVQHSGMQRRWGSESADKADSRPLCFLSRPAAMASGSGRLGAEFAFAAASSLTLREKGADWQRRPNLRNRPDHSLG